MRLRALVAIVLLMLPVGSSAQQRVRIGGRGPTRAAPLPPQAPTIARELAYVRLPVSYESYPIITHVVAPGLLGDGITSSWTSMSAGSRVDYRLHRFVSATLDMTSSLFGGPMNVQTVELGTRLRPERTEQRFYPFVDVRYGYMYAAHTNISSLDASSFPTSQQFGAGARYSQGFGAIGGAGMEIALTRRFSLTTGASVMRNRMTSYDFRGTTPTDSTYTMTTYRYILGLRFNPVRVIRPPGE